jgi:hypothetical protein
MKAYKTATKAASYIAERDGDCIEPQPFLSIHAFAELFPKTNLSFIESEPKFGIIDVNGTVRSLNPQAGIACRLLAKIDENTELVGLATFLLIVSGIWKIFRRRHEEKLKQAQEFAGQVCQILSTTDREVYQYDVKAQFRTKYRGIDAIWKYVVRYVEENSHVCVGVFGTRHEVYWKWTHMLS